MYRREAVATPAIGEFTTLMITASMGEPLSDTLYEGLSSSPGTCADCTSVKPEVGNPACVVSEVSRLCKSPISTVTKSILLRAKL
jgi:hypothetical protein